MVVLCKKLNLAYFPVPKVACTTLKTWFWEVNAGKPFPKPTLSARLSRRLTGSSTPLYASIHAVPECITKSHARVLAEQKDGCQLDGLETLVVVRDPIARLFSAWSNKVGANIFASRGEIEELRNALLDPDPDFGTFLDHLEEYRNISRPVRVHTHSYEWHLGPRLNVYNHVFQMEHMEVLRDFLACRTGRSVDLGRRNSSSWQTRAPGRLSTTQMDTLRRITTPEYAWLGEGYDIEAGMDKLLRRLERVT